MINPVVYEFSIRIPLKLPKGIDRDGALESINLFWYGETTVPIPTPEYEKSSNHLEAIYNVFRAREGLVKVSIHADGSWTIHPNPFSECENEVSTVG